MYMLRSMAELTKIKTTVSKTFSTFIHIYEAEKKKINAQQVAEVPARNGRVLQLADVCLKNEKKINMKSSVKQTKIPFSERKLRVREKDSTPKKVESSDDENSPLKYKLVVSSESKIILRRSSKGRSRGTAKTSPDRPPRRESQRNTPKRGAQISESLTDDECEDCPTPSKRKCYNSMCKIEQTPEKGQLSTPSTLLSRLNLHSAESTRRKDKNSPERNDLKALKPKELFPSASGARKALYTASDSLPCREDEIHQLYGILKKHLKHETCGSIYIAGLPGTGKTASIDHVIKSEKIAKGFKIVKINCTSFGCSQSIYKKIFTELKIKADGKMDTDPRQLIEKYLLRKHKMTLLILDEIDQLETRSQSVLYKIFEWPSWEKARLVLIGIANAMDLTDRILPRLCARVELKPVVIHFAPYTKNEIQKILSHRLSEVGASAIFTSSSIELISAKVAGLSGDVRRALDLGRRVVEVSEATKLLMSPEKSPQRRISPKGINENLLTDFLKLNDYRRSPRKLNANGEKFEDGNHCKKQSSEGLMGTSKNATPTKTLRVSFLSESGRVESVSSKKKLFAEEEEEEGEKGSVLREITLNANTESQLRAGVRSPAKNSPGKTHGAFREKANSISPTKMDPSKNETFRKQCLLNSKSNSSDAKKSRKADFSVESKDVLNVMKNIYGSSKSLKGNSDDSSFPLHQKILVCSFLLISKKGNVKDLNVGKLHQVYTKICIKRGITPVDQSGFLLLCRQIEMRGIMQIGKGHGKLAKISLQWDEAEVTDALKDLNLLSSILNDVSCL